MAGDAGGGHGATTSVWIVTAVIMIGTLFAGISLIVWWLSPEFWIGVGLLLAGFIGGYFTHMMDMVTEYAPAPAHPELSARPEGT
jgi:hypothetical protein